MADVRTKYAKAFNDAGKRSAGGQPRSNEEIVQAATDYLREHQAENQGKWDQWQKDYQEFASKKKAAESAPKANQNVAEDVKIASINDVAASIASKPELDLGKIAALPSGAQTMKTAPTTQYAAATQNAVGASTAPLMYNVPDEVRERLAAESEARRDAELMEAYNKRQEQMAADKATMEAGVAELNQWSEGEKKALGQYVAQRNVAQANMLTGMYDPTATDIYMLNNPLVQKYGIDKVRQMAEIYERQQNEALAQQTQQAAAENVNGKVGNAIGQSALSVGINLVGNLTSLAGRAMEMQNRTGQFSTLQQNTAGDLPSLYASAVRGEVSQNISGDKYDEEGNQIEEGGALRQGGAYLYQGVMSLADSIARATFGGGAVGGAVLAASGSFSQAIGDASAAGATPTQAVLLGVATAGMEYLTEKIPMDEVFKVAKSGNTNVLKQMFKQAGVEITTEELSLFGTLAAEAAIMQEQSSYKQQIAEAMANGATYAEAKQMADNAIWEQVKETAIVSGISGGISGGSSAVVGNARNGNTQTDVQTPTQAEVATEAATAPVEQAQQVETTTQPQQAETAAEAAQMPKERQAAQDVADMLMGKEKPAQPEVAVQEQTQNVEQEAAKAPAGEQASMPQEQPQIKGTGAAEQNFSGKAQYQDLLTDDNVQRQRPDDVRDVEVPKKDAYDRDVSEFVGNAVGAKITPDNMVNTIEELVQEGALGFDKRSNQDALNDAAKEIEARGAYSVRSQITNNIANGKIKDGDIEKAMLLYAKFANRDSKQAIENASELMVDLATMAHMTGRNLQLFKLLRKLTPEGQVMTVRKMVTKNVDSMIHSGKVDGSQRPELNEQLLDEYKKAAAENARAVSAEQKQASEAKMQELQQAIMADAASQLKCTFKAKWDAWRYMAMLGNGRTQIRNIAGNALFVPYKAAKDTIGAAFELALPKEQRTKSIVTDPKLMQWARKDAKTTAVQDALMYTGKLGDNATDAKFSDQIKVFDNKILENTRKIVEALPQKGDMLFKNGYYASSLAGFLNARGYKLSDIETGNISDAVMAEARGYAINEAMKATFNDCNAFSDAISSIGRKQTDNPWSKAINYAAESVLPFRRTPANILVRFTEYSPIGILKGAWDMADKVSSGKLSAASAVDQLASGLAGSGALMLGYFMAKGIGGIKLTGGGTDEDEKRQGHQNYAIEFSIDGKEYSYTIDWAAPANLPLFVGANLYNAMEGNGADTSISALSRIWQASKVTFEPMLQLSCLSSLNDLVEGIRYAPEGEALYSIAADIATGYLTQGIPALARQAYQASKANKQTTFANDPDPTIRELQKVGAQIPFLADKYQTDKRNAWGETETTENGTIRAINAFLNPGTLKAIDNSAIEQEITRLNDAQTVNVTPPTVEKKISYTDRNGEEHKNQRLTEEQYQSYAQTQGQTAKRILDQLVQAQGYRNMTDAEKANTIKAVYEYAAEKGKQAALGKDYYSTADAWISKTKEGDLNAFMLQGSKKVLNSVVDNVVTNLAQNWAVSKAAKDDLEASWQTFDKMSKSNQDKLLEAVTGDTARYLLARRDNVSTKSWMAVTDKVNDLKPEKGEEKVSAYQKYEAITKTKNVSTSEVDALMRAYMPDYDPDNGKTQQTEIKYDYMRQVMKISPEKAIAALRIAGENGKKDQKKTKWRKLGLSQSQVDTLWNLLESNSEKEKIDVVAWSKSRKK